MKCLPLNEEMCGMTGDRLSRRHDLRDLIPIPFREVSQCHFLLETVEDSTPGLYGHSLHVPYEQAIVVFITVQCKD